MSQVATNDPTRYNMTACYISHASNCRVADETSTSTTTTTTTTTTQSPLARWALVDGDDDDSDPDEGDPPPRTPTRSSQRSQQRSDRTVTSPRPQQRSVGPQGPSAAAEAGQAMAATAVMLHLKAVNESISGGFDLVHKQLQKLVGYSESFFAKCFDDDSDDDAEGSGANSPTETPSTGESPSPSAESPTQTTTERPSETTTAAPDHQQHRNRREDPPIVLFPLGRPKVAEKPRRSADVEQFANATMADMRREMSKARAMWADLINSTMEAVRQELMQVPPLYISPLVERLEARVAGLEDHLRESNRIFQRAVDLVQLESRRNVRRVEEVINSTSRSCIEKRSSSKPDFIYCDGRMVQDPCSIDRSNIVFAKALESSFGALELVVLSSSNALGSDVGLLRADVDFLMKQTHRLASSQDEVAQNESTRCCTFRLYT